VFPQLTSPRSRLYSPLTGGELDGPECHRDDTESPWLTSIKEGSNSGSHHPETPLVFTEEATLGFGCDDEKDTSGTRVQGGSDHVAGGSHRPAAPTLTLRFDVTRVSRGLVLWAVYKGPGFRWAAKVRLAVAFPSRSFCCSLISTAPPTLVRQSFSPLMLPRYYVCVNIPPVRPPFGWP
jgi:hypothetical protein